MRKEFGDTNMHGDEFLPDEEARIIDHKIKQESSISLSMRQDDFLRHNREFNGTLFKYDLPVTNSPIVFRGGDLITLDEAEEATPNERLMDQLECDKDTAFESFIIKHQQMFNNEVDMYGDIKRAGDSQLKVSL